MTNKLEPILLQKQIEIANLRNQIATDATHPVGKIMRGEVEHPYSSCFKNALLSSPLAVIAEIKRKSPSKGEIAPIQDPLLLAERYISGGANALSILTDTTFFGGSLNDLMEVRKKITAPLLRKDFLIDEIQIAEAAAAGAHAVLCIVAAVGIKTKKLITFARSIGLDVLVEIHDENELRIALESGADIIGINNRNLSTFVVDTEHALKLADKIPSSIIKVAESGITDPSLAHRYQQAGFQAVLIGEALVKATDPAQFIQACRHG